MKSVLAALVTTAIAEQAYAGNQPPPVSGLLVLDLAGQAINTEYTQYNADFVASSSSSTVTFTFRHDPGSFSFDDAGVADLNAPQTSLLVNGGFETGDLTGWSSFQQSGVGHVGIVFQSSSYSHTGNYSWVDGATEGYDGLSQTFATTPGDTYQISFWMNQFGANTATFQQVSDNGQSGTAGNGIDLLVYAGDGLPPVTAVPEPSQIISLLAMSVVGGAGALIKLRRRK